MQKAFFLNFHQLAIITDYVLTQEEKEAVDSWLLTLQYSSSSKFMAHAAKTCGSQLTIFLKFMEYEYIYEKLIEIVILDFLQLLQLR